MNLTTFQRHFDPMTSGAGRSAGVLMCASTHASAPPRTSESTRVHALARTLLTLITLTLLTACSYSTGHFEEPGLRGKLIDATTLKPVSGAIVYGYYATAEGSLAGGETIKRIPHVFEVESDANGVFDIPPWKSDWAITRGEPRQRFPSIAIYKDGYKLDLQNLSTIADWVSQTDQSGAPVKANNVIDWTATPSKLKPVTTELERYNALNNSNAAYAEKGECGWEQHAKLLMAQHVANISLKRRLIPIDRRTANDMPKDAYPLGTANRTQDSISIEAVLVNPAPLHILRDAAKAAGHKWTCSDPEKLLLEVAPKLPKI
jgi:hypothetical protein